MAYSGPARPQFDRIQTAFSYAHHKAHDGMHPIGRLLYEHRSEGRLLSCADSSAAQEVFPVCVPGSGIRVHSSAVRLCSSPPDLLQVRGGGFRAGASSGGQSAGIPGRLTGPRLFSRAGNSAHYHSGESSHQSGVCSQLGEERTVAGAAASLFGSTSRHQDYACASVRAEEGSSRAGSPLVSPHDQGHGAISDDAVGFHVSSPLSGSAGVAAHAQPATLVRPAASEPSEAQIQVGDDSKVTQGRPGLLERSVRPDAGRPYGQSVLSHLSVHGRVSLGMGRDLPLTSSRRSVAPLRGAAHQPPGAGDCFAGPTTLRPPPQGTRCVSSIGQSDCGALHQPSGGCAVTGTAPPGCVAVAVGASESPLIDGSAHTGPLERRSGSHVSGRPSSRRVAAPSSDSATVVGTFRESGSGLFASRENAHSTVPLFLSDSPGRASPGCGRFRPSPMAEGSPLRVPPSLPCILPLSGQSALGEAVNHPDSPRPPGSPVVCGDD